MQNDEIKEILSLLNSSSWSNEAEKIEDYITNLQQESKIKDTNWESLKYYLKKLYYKDYIEEAISDDIDKKIKELESKVEIKGYQKDIKALQQENERLKDIVVEKDNQIKEMILQKTDYTAVNILEMKLEDYKSHCEKALKDIDLLLNGTYSKQSGEAVMAYMKSDCCNLRLEIIKQDLQNGSDSQ